MKKLIERLHEFRPKDRLIVGIICVIILVLLELIY